MIGRYYRFHGHASLRRVYQNGQTIRGPLFAIKFAVNDRRKSFRVAVVVSKKVSKLAVVRNRIRRRLYELIRTQQDQIVKPYDIVITVFHEQVAEMPAAEMEKLLIEQFLQAGILAKTSVMQQKPHDIVDTKKEMA